MEALKQYEIWWADLPQPAGRRPVLLLSRNYAYEFLSRVLAAEITTRIRWIPLEVPLGMAEGLPATSVANLDNLRMIDKSKLVARISELPTHRVSEVKRALGYALDWDELISVRP